MNFLDKLLEYLPIISIILSIISVILSIISPIISILWGIYKFNKQHEFNNEIQKEKSDSEKTLQKHGYKINKILEQQKFDHQRRLTEFSLYAKKKHEKCILLYENLSVAIIYIGQVSMTIQQNRSFYDYNEEDVQDFLQNLSITQERRSEILREWKENRENGIVKLRKLDTLNKYIKAINYAASARKALISAKLYLPKELADELEQYTIDLYVFACKIKRNYESIEDHMATPEISKQDEEMESIEKKFDVLTIKLQKELCQ